MYSLHIFPSVLQRHTFDSRNFTYEKTETWKIYLLFAKLIVNGTVIIKSHVDLILMPMTNYSITQKCHSVPTNLKLCKDGIFLYTFSLILWEFNIYYIDSVHSPAQSPPRSTTDSATTYLCVVTKTIQSH